MSLTQKVFPECLFCGSKNVDAEHVSQCSIVDAKQKLALRGNDTHVHEVLSSILSAKTFADAYDRATPEDRLAMWVCLDCLAFGGVEFATLCPHCQSFQTMCAQNYIDAI